ncbi:hypothetical protein B0H14DRAFT_3641906, partial [Mycena olivaceomarginata]
LNLPSTLNSRIRFGFLRTHLKNLDLGFTLGEDRVWLNFSPQGRRLTKRLKEIIQFKESSRWQLYSGIQSGLAWVSFSSTIMASPALPFILFSALVSYLFILKVLRDFSPVAQTILAPDAGDGIPYVFESLVSVVLVVLWLCDPTVGSQIAKYFTAGTSVFLAPVLAPRLHALLPIIISGARLPPIYVEATAFWGALLKQNRARRSSRVVPPGSPADSADRATGGSHRLPGPRVHRRRALAHTSRPLRVLKNALFLIVDVVFWQIPCAVHSLYRQVLMWIPTLGFCSGYFVGCVVRDILYVLKAASRHLAPLLPTSVSSLVSDFRALAIAATRKYEALGPAYELEATLFYPALFFVYFVAYGFIHVVFLGYPLRSAIPHSAGWALVGVLLFYCAEDCFPALANLEPAPAVDRVLNPEPEVPLIPANSALVKGPKSPATSTAPQSATPEDLPQAASSSPSPSSPPSSPYYESSSSDADSDYSDEADTDWSLVRRPLSRRGSLIQLPSDLHRALSPIWEVSSAASTSSASGTETETEPSPPSSPKHSAAAVSPRLASPPAMRPERVRQVSRTRARRDMAAFRSFSVALENKNKNNNRSKMQSGDGDLQSNAAVAVNDAGAGAETSEGLA